MITFWSFAGMGPFLIAVPYTTDASKTGPYVWINQGVGNAFTQPANAPGGRVGAVVGQFLMVGDVLQAQTELIGTGNGIQSTFIYALTHTPMLATGNVYDQAGQLAGTFNNGLINGTGLLAAPNLPGNLATLIDNYGGGVYANSVFAIALPSDPGQSLFTQITVNSVAQTSASAVYTYSGGIAQWVWNSAAFGMGSGVTYPVSFVPTSLSTSIVAGSGSTGNNSFPANTAITYFADSLKDGVYVNTQLQITTPTDPGQFAFSSVTVNGVVLNASAASYNYNGVMGQWTWSTQVGFIQGVAYPLRFTGSSWIATMIAGTASVFVQHVGTITTNGYQAPTPLSANPVGSINSNISFIGFQTSTGTGTINTAGSSTVNYESGDLTLVLNAAPPIADQIYAQYTTSAPSRLAWSAVADPTHWPIPLTADAIAFQSGYEDLEIDLGPLMFIAGYPLYAVVFQRMGITRANYVGGNVVWSFGVYSRNRGLIAKGAAIQVGTLVYFLSQDGFFVTDGNSVSPIGTDQDNNLGMDNWFWANVNKDALEAIRCGYDTTTRCISFSIPTGINTLPDTLLSYNPIANKWTKSAIPTELIWTDSNGSTDFGTQLRLGVFTQTHQYSVLQGPTLNGYLETCDLMDTDANLRFTTGVRPNVASMDTPQALVGVRNSLMDNISYTPSSPPDSFSRIVPVLAEGLYTRVRVSATQASAINGATVEQQPGGTV